MTVPTHLRDLFVLHRIVPVVTIDRPDDASRLADALLSADIGIVEITLRSAAGLEAIRRVKRSHPWMIVAAGTVLSVDQMIRAAAAGADFALSPGSTPVLLEAALTHAFAYVPGVATPSEAMRVAEVGYDFQKFFPAEAAGGVAMLKGLTDPLSHVRFCPTGGIGPANLADYLSLPNVLCAGGSWIATRRAIADSDWEGVSFRAAHASRIAREATTSSQPHM